MFQLHEHLQNISNKFENEHDSDVEFLEEQESTKSPIRNVVKKRKWDDDTWLAENKQVKENYPITLIHMGARRKISNNKFDFTVDVDESHENQLHTPKPSISCPNKRKFQDVSGVSDPVSKDTICKKRKRKVKRNKDVKDKNNQVVSSAENLKPFDYSSVDYGKFQGGSKANQSQPSVSKKMDNKFKGKVSTKNVISTLYNVGFIIITEKE